MENPLMSLLLTQMKKEFNLKDTESLTLEKKGETVESCIYDNGVLKKKVVKAGSKTFGSLLKLLKAEKIEFKTVEGKLVLIANQNQYLL